MAGQADALDRRDGATLILDRERKAGNDALALDQHRAGTARSLVAALLGTGQSEMLAQQIEKRGADIGVDVGDLVVDRELHGPAFLRFATPSVRVARPVNRFLPASAVVSPQQWLACATWPNQHPCHEPPLRGLDSFGLQAPKARYHRSAHRITSDVECRPLNDPSRPTFVIRVRSPPACLPIPSSPRRALQQNPRRVGMCFSRRPRSACGDAGGVRPHRAWRPGSRTPNRARPGRAVRQGKPQS